MEKIWNCAKRHSWLYCDVIRQTTSSYSFPYSAVQKIFTNSHWYITFIVHFEILHLHLQSNIQNIHQQWQFWQSLFHVLILFNLFLCILNLLTWCFQFIHVHGYVCIYVVTYPHPVRNLMYLYVESLKLSNPLFIIN